MVLFCYNNLINMNKVITRFAPSPTGLFHAGSYRTALFAYIFAKKNNGKFILRIEDTDKARSKKEYEENIIESLKWMGLDYDEFHRQSERIDIHRKAIEKLIASGHAYISKEIPKEEGGRTEVIRFKNPNKKVSWIDIIRGKVEFDTTELGDFVIAKGFDEPVFHLVVVVDDNDMGVTHIIRGEDHISNTPRQILIYEALGASLPQYAHIPLVLGSDRSKLSKRKGALPISEYKNRGYLSQAIINYMAFLGWNPGDEREIMSLEEIIKEFTLEKVHKSGAIFNEEKLNWMNRQYIEKLSDEEFLNNLKKFTEQEIDKKVLPLVREKIYYFNQISNLLNDELSFINSVQKYDKEKLMWKQEKDISLTKQHIKFIIDNIDNLSEDFSQDEIKSLLWPYAEKNGRGNVLWPMRYALSGKDKSPDPFVISCIIGKKETLARLKFAYDLI